MPKEILTPSNCKKDLAPPVTKAIAPHMKTIESSTMIACILGFIVAIVLGSVFIISLSSYDNLRWLGICMGVFIMSLGIFGLLVNPVSKRIEANRAEKRAIEVKTYEIEFIEDTLEHAYIEFRSGRNAVNYCILCFKSFGDYRVPAQQHYAWSELYSMSPKGIYVTSIIGDTFYIAIRKDDPKKTPLWVYNTKLFELCPDGTTRARTSWKDSVSLE